MAAAALAPTLGKMWDFSYYCSSSSFTTGFHFTDPHSRSHTDTSTPQTVTIFTKHEHRTDAFRLRTEEVACLSRRTRLECMFAGHFLDQSTVLILLLLLRLPIPVQLLVPSENLSPTRHSFSLTDSFSSSASSVHFTDYLYSYYGVAIIMMAGGWD